MNSISHRYADFGSDLAADDSDPALSSDDAQDETLRAFEEGYKAGWTDAEKNMAADQAAIGSEFVHTLQDLAFTYHEALARLNRGLQPMFEQMTTAFFPRILPPALRAHVVAELMQIAKTQSEGELVLRVSDSDLAMVEELIYETDLHLPVRVVADETLTAHQLMLDLDVNAREINLDQVVRGITEALNAFNFHSQTEASHD